MTQNQKQIDFKRQQSNSNSSYQDEDDQQIDPQLGDFIVNDDEEESSYEQEDAKDYDDQKENKKKKKKKKDKKKKKEKKKKHEHQSYDQDDLDLIDNDQKLMRLKKRKQSRKQSDYDDHQFQEDMLDNEIQAEQDDIQSDDDEPGYPPQEVSDSISEINEVIHQNRDIFDPIDIYKLSVYEQDQQVVNLDLPQRYIGQLKRFAKNVKKSISQIKVQIEKQDKTQQATWIYQKLKHAGILETYEQKDCKQKIKQVLQCLHQENLQIMYIYYYRKKIFADYLNLNILWKIYELDQQWFAFRQKQKKYISFLQSYFLTNQKTIRYLMECIQTKYLSYFQNYTQFIQKNWNLNSEGKKNSQDETKKKTTPGNYIQQMEQSGLNNELLKAGYFLSPEDLCDNIEQRNHSKVEPNNPKLEPKDQFQKLINEKLKSSEDKAKFPALNSETRFKTIIKYLSYELFTYPQLRKILRDKYYKKLIISTTPTKKGNQDIDLYNTFFPVKRIKDKPVSTLKRQVWILALQAQKLDLIKIQLRFQWQLSNTDKNNRQSKQRDSVYIQLAKCYYQISSKSDIWNLLRKRVLHGLINEYFIPAFMKQIKQDFTKQGEKQIINLCCQKFRSELMKGQILKTTKVLSMVLQDTKLGVAFMDESGKSLFTYTAHISNDEDLKRFVGDQSLTIYIKQYKTDMILIAANCKRAQTLRKLLRDRDLFPHSIFSSFGQYQVPRLVAKKKIIEGVVEQEAILEAISMARLKRNPMAQIISLWSDKIEQNGVLSLNLYQYQSFVDQKKLKDSLEKVIIEVVNLVGLDLNEIKNNEHLQNQLQFISGLGPRKAFILLQGEKDQQNVILNRKAIQKILSSKVVAKNCSPFLKIQTNYHKNLFEKLEKQKKANPIKQYEDINLLDLTRIPIQWYSNIIKRLCQSYKPISLSEIRKRKEFAKLSDQNIILLQIFKNPERIRGIEWRFKDNYYIDEELIKSQFMSRFRSPRDQERVMDNKEIFFNLLRQTPQTLKRYMIMQVKVLSLKKNYLNVIIPQNGLFGYIKIPPGKSQQQMDKLDTIYQKGTTIKAVIIGFPFDQKTFRDQQQPEEQELLKIQMALDFPHKDPDRHQGSRHDWMTGFPAIVKQLHPLIDLQKDRFELRRQDRPVIEVKQEKVYTKTRGTDFRRISHPKFKNISAVPAIQFVKQSANGQFIIRPSSQGPQYLTITWNFCNGVIVHLKIRCQHKGMNSMAISYRIQDKDNRSYNSLQQIIERCIKPMNGFVQDVVSSKKFLLLTIEEIQNQVKRDMQNDSSHIYYYFGVSQDYPQYFLLIYMYKDKKPIKQLIKVKSSGLYFHEQQFSNLRQLIVWFKEHLKEKQYQKYVKNASQILQKMK